MFTLLLLLPYTEEMVQDTYDGAIWNVVDKKANGFTQLLFVTYTRNGMRYEAFRVLSQPPIVEYRRNHCLLFFNDVRNKCLRKVRVRTYSVIRSDHDIELKNRKLHPLGHRRDITIP